MNPRQHLQNMHTAHQEALQAQQTTSQMDAARQAQLTALQVQHTTDMAQATMAACGSPARDS